MDVYVRDLYTDSGDIIPTSFPRLSKKKAARACLLLKRLRPYCRIANCPGSPSSERSGEWDHHYHRDYTVAQSKAPFLCALREKKESTMNRSQPDRAQKRARAGQTYYPPTVEDDPTAQGDMKPTAPEWSGEAAEPSPKRQKDSHGNPRTPEKPPQNSQTPNIHAPSSSTTSSGFTPINAPRSPLPTASNSASRFAGSHIDEELPYNAQSKLRAIFLSGDKFISQNTLRAANDMLGKLEREPLIPNGLLEDSMLEKTLKEILALEKIPGDTGFHFRMRLEKLLKIWHGWTAEEKVWAPTAKESTARPEKAKQKKPQSAAKQDTLAELTQAQVGGRNVTNSVDASVPSPRLSASPSTTTNTTNASNKGKEKALERDSEMLSPEKLDIMDFVEDNADLLQDIYTGLGVEENTNKTAGSPKNAETSSKGTKTTKSTPKVSPKSTSAPKGILKSPKKTPKKLSSSGPSSSKTTPGTPQQRATTTINLTTPQNSSNSGNNPGDDRDEDAVFAAALDRILKKDDPAELLQRRSRDLKKRQEDVQLDLELMDDVQRELDTVTKIIDDLQKKLAEAEKQKWQISDRLKEIMGIS